MFLKNLSEAKNEFPSRKNCFFFSIRHENVVSSNSVKALKLRSLPNPDVRESDNFLLGNVCSYGEPKFLTNQKSVTKNSQVLRLGSGIKIMYQGFETTSENLGIKSYSHFIFSFKLRTGTFPLRKQKTVIEQSTVILFRNYK